MHTIRRIMTQSHILRQRRWILHTNNDNSFSQKNRNQFESLSPEFIEKKIINRIEILAPKLIEQEINHQFTILVPTLIEKEISNRIKQEISKQNNLNSDIPSILLYLFIFYMSCAMFTYGFMYFLCSFHIL